MYCITDIYCTNLQEHINHVFMGKNLSLSRSNSRLYMSSYDYDKIKLEIYDTKDKSSEWLDLKDVFEIMTNTGVSIDGITGITYFQSNVKNGDASLVNPDSVKHVSVRNNYQGAKYTGMDVLAKQRLLGVKFDQFGTLKRISNAFIKGNVLTLPDNILSIHFSIENPDLSEILEVSVSSNFKFKDYSRELHTLLIRCHRDVKLVIRGDFKMTATIFSRLECFEIQVTGSLTCPNLSKVNFSGLSKYAPFYKRNINKVFYLSDPKKVYRFDMETNTFELNRLFYRRK